MFGKRRKLNNHLKALRAQVENNWASYGPDINRSDNWIGGHDCLYLSMGHVAEEIEGFRSPRAIARMIHGLGFRRDIEVFTWNDAPGRTHHEVLARIDAAIDPSMK